MWRSTGSKEWLTTDMAVYALHIAYSSVFLSQKIPTSTASSRLWNNVNQNIGTQAQTLQTVSIWATWLLRMSNDCVKKLIKKKELHHVNGTGFSDPTAFYHLWAYCKKKVSKTGKNNQHKTKERCKECIDGIKYSTRQKVKSESTDTYSYFCPL